MGNGCTCSNIFNINFNKEDEKNKEFIVSENCKNLIIIL